jgi:hypothetical protein
VAGVPEPGGTSTVKCRVAEALPPSVSVRVTVRAYEPFARALYDVPERDPFFPEATGASQASDDEVGPERTQDRAAVAFGFLL